MALSADERPGLTWMRAPALVPAGWQVQRGMDLTDPDSTFLLRQWPDGLRATCSDEIYSPEAIVPGNYRGAGTYRRIVFSYADRIPPWERMRDAIRGSGLFDPKRDVVMLLPPQESYVNVHPYAMHWLQFVREWRGRPDLTPIGPLQSAYRLDRRKGRP